jgi:hypothetical protein
MDEGFKRINFFNGFFTSAEDWTAAEKYHNDKRRLHNQYLHTPGIVRGCLDSFGVTVSEGGKTLEIGPGLAIDGEGRELYLPTAQRLSFDVQQYKSAAIVYLTIRYHEEPIDNRTNDTNPTLSGHAFFREWPEISMTTDKPDNKQSIEVARIVISKDSTAISENDVDQRFIKSAAAVMPRPKLEELGTIVKEGSLNVVSRTTPSKEDANVLIETVKGKAPRHFYLANVFVTEEGGRVQWRIESFAKKTGMEYRLMLSNLSDRDVLVFFEVFKFY